MEAADVYLELYSRIPPLARRVVDGLDQAQLTRVAAPGTNPVGWLVWHLTRVQDHHVAELLAEPQIWETSSSAEAFGLQPDAGNTGYGHSPEDVASVRPESGDVLVGYLEEVDARTRAYLVSLEPEAFDVVIDTRWDPPVTLGVRLVSVADDSLQHLGQAAYLRGVLGT